MRATFAELRDLRWRRGAMTSRSSRTIDEWLLTDDGRLVPIDPAADISALKNKAEEMWLRNRQVIAEAQALCARVRQYLMASAALRRRVGPTIH